MIRLALICSLAFLVSGCAMDAFSRPSLIAYGGAPSTVAKAKPVHVAKAKAKKAGAVPVSITPQPATPTPKAKTKKKHWWQFGR